MKRLFKSKFVRWVILPIIVIASAIWAWVVVEFPTCTVRYRLTAEIITPDGLKTGSSVVQASYHTTGSFLSGPKQISDIVGESLYVDLGQSKNLFITLTHYPSSRIGPGNEPRRPNFASDAGWLLVKALGLTWHGSDERELCRALTEFNGLPAKEVPFQILPLVVAFKDITDPLSATEVDPTNVGATYGDGYTFRKATVALTNDRPSTGIEKILPWYPAKKHDPNRLGVTSVNDPLEYQIERVGAHKQPIVIGESK